MTFFLIILAIIIIGSAVYFAHEERGQGGDGNVGSANTDEGVCMDEQEKEKRERLAQILHMVKDKGQINNDDVEELLGVSNTTATRYLSDLEREGALRQIGEVGRGVYYVVA